MYKYILGPSLSSNHLLHYSFVIGHSGESGNETSIFVSYIKSSFTCRPSHCPVFMEGGRPENMNIEDLSDELEYTMTLEILSTLPSLDL